jgi:hypothetical protein
LVILAAIADQGNFYRCFCRRLLSAVRITALVSYAGFGGGDEEKSRMGLRTQGEQKRRKPAALKRSMENALLTPSVIEEKKAR